MLQEEEEDGSAEWHIRIFLVGDGTFVSFGLRQRKKTDEGVDVGE
jgi:hypothetical protein